MKIIGRKLLLGIVMCLMGLPLTASAIPIPDDDGNSHGWIAQYSVSYAYAKVGKPVSVKWQSLFTVGCIILTNQTGSHQVATSGNTTVTPTQPSTMSVTLSCAGTNGQTTSQTRSFSVNRADHPELNSLSVSSETVDAGSLVTLSWESSFADFCELTGTNNDVLLANGSRSFTAELGTNTFRVSCKQNDGRISNPITKTVIGRSPYPEIYNFYTTPTLGLGYSVIWFAYADFCVIDGVYQAGSSGSRFYWDQGYLVTHQLTCSKNGYSTYASAIHFPAPRSGAGGGEPILQEDTDSGGNQF